jgi:hypothetical protein
MAISHTLTVDGDRLTVVATGADDNLEDVLAYGEAVIGAAIKAGVRLVYCDERGLEYRIGTLDTHRAASVVAEHAPKVACVAIVCHERHAKDARFFETVAMNRGLLLRAFTDADAAQRWLAGA